MGVFIIHHHLHISVVPPSNSDTHSYTRTSAYPNTGQTTNTEANEQEKNIPLPRPLHKTIRRDERRDNIEELILRAPKDFRESSLSP